MSKKTTIATNLLGKEVRMLKRLAMGGGVGETPNMPKSWSGVQAEVCNVYIDEDGRSPVYSLINLNSGEIREFVGLQFIVPRTSTETEARTVAENTQPLPPFGWKRTYAGLIERAERVADDCEQQFPDECGHILETLSLADDVDALEPGQLLMYVNEAERALGRLLTTDVRVS